MDKEFKKIFLPVIISSIVVSAIVSGATGFFVAENFFRRETAIEKTLQDGKLVKVNEESAVVSAVEKVSPSVVSIIVSKDLPVIEQYFSNPSSRDDFFSQFFGDDFNFQIPQYRQNGTKKQEVGGGSGFIVSSDGYIVTNKHVVSDESAEYTVLMNDGKKVDAKVLARDPVGDVAILKIDGKDLPAIELGDSSDLKVGQSVIAIGNALGEFRNTVSTGVISGLSRSVTAGGAGIGAEQLTGVIQTDASINPGNSGGPLLNIAGQVIGINTAMAQGAQNIGFAIPINEVKSAIESVKKDGRIIRPWLGIRYSIINKEIAEANKLSVDYGALIVRGDKNTDLAVIPGSPADKVGLVENDIILEVNGVKINEDNSLVNQVGKFQVGDEITLKVLHKGKEENIKVKLEEMKN
jgi:S1-C subfamily serine protease